jgi:hypothetical protein
MFCGAFAEAGQIVVEDDVEKPVQPVFNMPVSPDRLGEGLGVDPRTRSSAARFPSCRFARFSSRPFRTWPDAEARLACAYFRLPTIKLAAACVRVRRIVPDCQIDACHRARRAESNNPTDIPEAAKALHVLTEA